MTAKPSTPMERLEQLENGLRSAFAALGGEVSRHRGELTLTIPRERVREVMARLRDGPAFRFDECMDVCGVDYLAYGESEWTTAGASSSGFGRAAERERPDAGDGERRFAVVYHLLSVALNQRLRVKAFSTRPSRSSIR